MDCLFCKIIAGEIPSKKIYEDDKILCFYDIDPQAPVHFLAIPKKHIDSLETITEEDAQIVSNIFLQISQLCKQLNINDGYRVVTNCGKDGGQSVEHLHFHVLAKRSLKWPPG